MVQVLTGKDAGKSGKVLEIDKKTSRLRVDGINVFKKFVKSQTKSDKGSEAVTMNRSLSISNVLILCKNCGKASRIGYKIEGDKKFRICKKCKAVI